MKPSMLRLMPVFGWRMLVVLTLLTVASGIRAEPVPVAGPVTGTMHSLASDVRVLLPLIYQFDKPATLADRDLISKQISNMLAHVERVAVTVAPRADTYQISYQALALQLKQVQQELARGRDEYAITLLRSATSVCATCHTQDDRPAVWMAPPGDGMEDAFVAGEFLFMTRQYDSAFKAYESWLREQQTLNYDERTRSAFERLLLTALQMKKSSRAIADLLGEFTARDTIDGALARDLADWISGINALQDSADITRHPGTDTLKTMATQWLGTDKDEPFGHLYMPETQRPRIVWLRGELYRALINETDRGMIPDWLYWLAVSDRLLEYRFYYSLADMYLKQCMVEYTDDPIARRCYREYENYVEVFYSGSAGTHIPADVEAELKALKSKVFSGKTSATAPRGQ